jgi:uncharacterized membrane protein YgcG
MKSPILLIAISALVFGGCSTAYKTGQTPDDVYFSPSPPQEEYVVTGNNKDDQKYRGADYDEDRYLRMRVRDRYRWSQLDDWYNYERYNVYYNFGYSYNWYNPWNPYSSWNYLYNPYCHSCCYSYTSGNPKSTAYSKPRTFNLNTFNTNTTTGQAGNKIFNSKTSGAYRPTNVTTNKTSNNNNNNSGLGNTLRNIFNNSSGSNKSDNSSSSGSGSSSSGSSGSSGSSAPVRKF